ncbi:unnamed protein product [Allacma fusca]|uniref:Uncharacterized protein n=1 Tax=Allacma fusca TaxID=39272 RepID=A0A8J2P9U7_9HEXA|nr:unnamed protein product [Allacma fusca]
MGTCASYLLPFSVRSKLTRDSSGPARNSFKNSIQETLQFSYDTSDTEWLMTSAEDDDSSNGPLGSYSPPIKTPLPPEVLQSQNQNQAFPNKTNDYKIPKNLPAQKYARNSRTPTKGQGQVKNSGDQVPLLSISLSSDDDDEEEFSFKTGLRDELQFRDFPLQSSSCPSPELIHFDLANSDPKIDNNYDDNNNYYWREENTESVLKNSIGNGHVVSHKNTTTKYTNEFEIPA